MNPHQTVGDDLHKDMLVISLGEDGGRLFSSLRVESERETLLLYTSTINTAHSSCNSAHLLCMLPLFCCVGFMTQVMSKAPHVQLQLLPPFKRHNGFIITLF